MDTDLLSFQCNCLLCCSVNRTDRSFACRRLLCRSRCFACNCLCTFLRASRHTFECHGCNRAFCHILGCNIDCHWCIWMDIDLPSLPRNDPLSFLVNSYDTLSACHTLWHHSRCLPYSYLHTVLLVSQHTSECRDCSKASCYNLGCNTGCHWYMW